MAFGIGGFGASQAAASPQVFQALSFGGRPPQPPASPYGTPHGTPHRNLTLAAQPAFDALVRIGVQAGTVSFALQGPPPSGIPPLTNIAPVTPNYAIKQIARTVTNLAVARVYPAAVFSLHA